MLSLRPPKLLQSDHRTKCRFSSGQRVVPKHSDSPKLNWVAPPDDGESYQTDPVGWKRCYNWKINQSMWSQYRIPPFSSRTVQTPIKPSCKSKPSCLCLSTTHSQLKNDLKRVTLILHPKRWKRWKRWVTLRNFIIMHFQRFDIFLITRLCKAL